MSWKITSWFKPTCDVCWPKNWRERLADGDPKALKHLKGFRSPAHFYQSFKALRREYTKAGQKLNAILKQYPELK